MWLQLPRARWFGRVTKFTDKSCIQWRSASGQSVQLPTLLTRESKARIKPLSPGTASHLLQKRHICWVSRTRFDVTPNLSPLFRTRAKSRATDKLVFAIPSSLFHIPHPAESLRLRVSPTSPSTLWHVTSHVCSYKASRGRLPDHISCFIEMISGNARWSRQLYRSICLLHRGLRLDNPSPRQVISQDRHGTGPSKLPTRETMVSSDGITRYYLPYNPFPVDGGTWKRKRPLPLGCEASAFLPGLVGASAPTAHSLALLSLSPRAACVGQYFGLFVAVLATSNDHCMVVRILDHEEIWQTTNPMGP